MNSSTSVSIQERPPYEPTCSRGTYLALSALSAIILVATIFFMVYIAQNYTPSEGEALAAFIVSEVTACASIFGLVSSTIGFFTDKADSPPPVIHSQPEVVR